jgi:hypothetical protein
MIRISEKSDSSLPKNRKNTLAPKARDMVEFRRYTQQVWSKVAARELTDFEVDQILEIFGRFLLVLAERDRG